MVESFFSVIPPGRGGRGSNPMLKRNRQIFSAEPNEGIWGGSSAEQFSYFIKVIRRRFALILILMAMCIGLGVTYLVNAAPIFVATTSIAIDANQLKSADSKTDHGDIVVDSGLIQTQMAILKSSKVGRSVVEELRLYQDPEFVGSGPGLKDLIFDFFTGLFRSAEKPAAPSESLVKRRVLAALEDRLSITRVGQSYVIDITARSTNAEKAAQIANMVASAYIEDQLDAKYAATRQASNWLQERMRELEAQTSAQQLAVAEFREKNNIVDAGGRLINDQQLSELNSQLILARAATAQAKARYDRITEIMTQKVPDASVADVLQNPTIIRLRGQYLDLASREAIYAQKYGPNHLSVVNLRTQMSAIVHSIQDEMRKIEQSYKSDYEIALAREQSLSKSLASGISQSQTTNIAQITLGELQSRAETLKSLHDNFLQRNLEAVQQQSFPITEARIISPAETPLSKAYPKTILVLLVAIVGGMVVSFSAALVTEQMDRVFRSGEQLEEALHATCLALLPRLQVAAATGDEGLRRGKTKPVAFSSSSAAPSGRTDSESVLDFALREPLSHFSEALRMVKMANDLVHESNSGKVIAFTSALANEGKSTISANFAQLVADSGDSVVLIDADLRNPSLSRQLATADQGLVDVLSGSKAVADVLLVDQRSGLRFLPAGQKSKMPHTNVMLASDAMKKLVDALRETYDCVVLDLSPLVLVVDARATVRYVDSYVYVVEWGRTRIDTAKYALSGAPELYDRLLGVVMNKVDMAAISKFDPHQGYYYEKYRERYGEPRTSRRKKRSVKKNLST
jgi:succinoglycan biosynthesis transport protein ExoP